MCLETVATANKDGGKTERKSEKIQMTIPHSLSASPPTFPKSKLIKRTNSYTFPDENEKLASKVKEEMAEKKKKLPPGYVNVSTKNLSNVGIDDDIKVGKENVFYVNTGVVKTEDVISRNQSESLTSQDLGNKAIETSAFKFELDPIKPEIPIRDSSSLSPSISPPPQQKLSPKNTSAKDQRISREFPSNNHSHFSRNDISSLDDLCDIEEIKKEDDEIEDSIWLDTLNKENIFFEEARSQPSSPLKRPNSYQNVSSGPLNRNSNPLKSSLHCPDLQTNKNLDDAKISELFSSPSVHPINDSSRQYLHSAGGSCVSPIGDTSPHILITSQNCFPYGRPNLPKKQTERFSVNNPFLPLINKGKKPELLKGNNTNPFIQAVPEENEHKNQLEFQKMSQSTTISQAPFLNSHDVTNAINTSIFDPNNTSTSIFPTHIHHHHFYHPEQHTDNFTPPPSINFPRNEMNFIGRQNSNFSHFEPNQNMQLVLTPKKDELSYKDLEKILHLNKALLKKCGWYYGKIRADESTALLADTKPGTFLVRDSSDPKYWFSLSMQRGNTTNSNIASPENSGPTSIRIHFVNGKFQLDAEDRIRSLMPEFDTIIDLVQFYITSSLNALKQVQNGKSSKENEDDKILANAKSKTLWVDSSGKLYQTIFLAYPLYKKDSPQSLFQICRLSINQSIVSKITKDFSENNYQKQQYLDSVSKLNLPGRIQEFLEEYPNTI